MLKTNKTIFLLPFLSGILLGIGYSLEELRFLLWFALIPLSFFLFNQKKEKTGFWGGYLTGLIFFGITTSWFLFAAMADWVSAENRIVIILILALTWLVYIFFASVFIGAVTYLFSRPKSGNWLDIFLFPALWVIFEYLRSWGLTIFAFGPGSLWGPHFTLGHLGYAAADSPFLFLAGLAGVYGLSFLIVSVNCLFFFLTVSLKRPFFLKDNIVKFGFCSLVIFFLIFTGVYFRNSHNDTLKNKSSIPVTLIQTNFPSLFNYTPQQQKEFLDTKLNLFNETPWEKEWPRIIVFPEHANFLKKLNQFYPDFFSSGLTAKQKNALIIDSGWYFDGQTSAAVTRLIYFDLKEKKIIGRYDKVLLMPVGDFLPYFLTAVLTLTGRQDWIVNMEMTRGYERGEDLTVVDYAGIKIGGLMCSEVISPYLYRDLSRNGAEILVSVASDAVFQGDRFLLAQLLAIVKTRAVENNRYFIQAANQGDSLVIDNQGTLIAKNKKIGNEIINAEVKAMNDITVYNKFGDWILVLASLIVTTVIIKGRIFFPR